ncbi:32648_t:CDS:2, partial [Gigaspora margarita]
MASELEVLKQRITELEAENGELREKNTKIRNLRFKLSVSDTEIAELKRRNADFLIVNREYNEKRDAKVKKLEQKNAELEARLAVVEKSYVVVGGQPQNDKEAISEMLPEISAPNNNADIKSSKDQKMDTFLDDAHKKSVSNAIRQRNREKKLLRKLSTKDLSGDVSLLSKPPASSVTQDKESRSHRKKLEAESIMQDVFDFTMDGSEKKQLEGALHMTEISLTGRKENNCQEKIESQEGLAELSSSDVLQNINRLYENACTAENERVKVNQAEILCWRNFIIGLDNSIDEIMIKEKVGMKKAKGLIYDFILVHNPDTKRNTLYQRINRARKVYEFTEKIGIDKIKYIKTYNANAIADLSVSQIQTIIDFFSKNSNTELPDDQEGPVNADDGDPNSINDNSDSYYSEEEMPDESDDDGYSGYSGYSGCGGYNKYSEYGESDKGYYYDLSSGKKTSKIPGHLARCILTRDT